MALGDSYAAGVGAGGKNDKNTEITDFDKCCLRSTKAYSFIVNKKLQCNYFISRACSGASVAGSDGNTIYHQLPGFEGVYDLITVTVGGNDIDFAAIAEKCIVQYLSLIHI